MNMRELAEHFDVSYRTVCNWKKDGAPFTPQGKAFVADPDEIEAWAKANGKYMKHGRNFGPIRNKRAKTPSVGEISKQVQKDIDSKYQHLTPDEIADRLAKKELEKRTLEVEKRKIALDVQRGKLIAREDVERGRVERISIVRAAMLGLPDKMAPRLHEQEQDEIRRLLLEEVKALIALFSGEFEGLD